MHGTRVNWVGMTGAVVLFGYGWWREPLAAVLGGMILLADLLAMEVSVRKRDCLLYTSPSPRDRG